MKCSAGPVSCEPDAENPRVHLRWREPRRRPLQPKYYYRHIIRHYFVFDRCPFSRVDHYSIVVLLRIQTPLFCESPAVVGIAACTVHTILPISPSNIFNSKSLTQSLSLGCMEISIHSNKKKKNYYPTPSNTVSTPGNKNLGARNATQSCTYLSRAVDSPCSRDRDRRPVSISDQIVLARHGTAKEVALS